MDFDIKGALAAGYTKKDIEDYLRLINTTPRGTLPASVGRMSPQDAESTFQQARSAPYVFQPLDMRPTRARPLVGGPQLDTSPEAGEALLRNVIMPGLELGTAGLGGPAAMTLRGMTLPTAQALIGPFDNPDPNVLAGGTNDWTPDVSLSRSPAAR